MSWNLFESLWDQPKFLSDLYPTDIKLLEENMFSNTVAWYWKIVKKYTYLTYLDAKHWVWTNDTNKIFKHSFSAKYRGVKERKWAFQ